MSDKKPQVIHRKRLFNGRTAEEVHTEVTGQRCSGCGAPAPVAVRVYAPLGEVAVDYLAALSVQFDGSVPVVETKHGKFVRVAQAFACARCTPALERTAAKHPSSWFVDIDRGPGPERPTVAVG